jgi:hypothetical protein
MKENSNNLRLKISNLLLKMTLACNSTVAIAEKMCHMICNGGRYQTMLCRLT